MGNFVNVPPKDCLTGGPGPIFLTQLLLGDGVFTVGVRLLVRAENPLDLVEEVTEHLAPLPGVPMENLNEVVQVDINVFHGSGVLLRWEVLPAVVILGLWCD